MKIERSKNPILFFSKKENKAIIEAIARTEKVTSGEIRVHLESRAQDPFFERAKEIFEKIGMTKTKDRNGVLIFIGLERRQFAILGDRGINEKVPENYWEEVVREMRIKFASDCFAEGIVAAIESIGEKLKSHFPYLKDDKNELSDKISYSI